MTTVQGELHEVQRAATQISAVLRPASWEAAMRALGRHPGSRAIAGGTDLLVDLARSSGDPVTLIDLSAIEGADHIDEIDDHLVLGAGVTHNQIVADGRFTQHCLPLAQACLEIGSPQLRNRATVAGNVATASPANDSISALMALGARIELARMVDGIVVRREVDISSFFTGFRATVCEADELITAIRVPKLQASQRAIWVKVGLRRAQAISVVHAAMVVEIRDDRVIDARLALGSVGPTVMVNHIFPAALLDRVLDDATAASAAAAVAASIEPIDDIRATAEYRTAVTEAVLARALRTLADDRADAAWPDDPPVLGRRPPRSRSAGTVTPLDHGADPQLVTDETLVSMEVNGESATGSSAASTTLLDWLRDHSSVPCSGVKEGCAEGECGACTVRLDGAAVMSCLVAAVQADGAEITTVEGLAGAPGQRRAHGRTDSAGRGDPVNTELHPLQAAFVDEFAVQCGFCIPGFLVAASALLDEHPAPTDEQIELGLAGNLCRCTGYYPITQAVRRAGGGS